MWHTVGSQQGVGQISCQDGNISVSTNCPHSTLLATLHHWTVLRNVYERERAVAVPPHPSLAPGLTLPAQGKYRETHQLQHSTAPQLVEELCERPTLSSLPPPGWKSFNTNGNYLSIQPACEDVRQGPSELRPVNKAA